MDKKTRITIIVGCIVTFIIVPAVTVLILSKNAAKQQPKQDTSKVDNSKKTQLPNRSNDELTEAITNSDSGLSDSGKPTFAIQTVTKPAIGWYVVTIHLLDDPQGTNPAKMLVQDDGSRLNVLLGPGTSFPTDTTEDIGVPDVVAKELNQ